MSLNILMRSIGFFVVAIVCYFSVSNGITLFVWHPILMSIGFLLLMTEAILAFSSNSLVSNNLKYNDKLTLHWLLQVGAATSIAIAFYSIYTHKNNNNYDHFISQHASRGLTTILMMIGTTFGGIAARYSSAFKKSIRPIYLKIVHSTFGSITYILAIYTFCLGLDTAWFRSQSNTQIQQLLTYSTMIMAFLAIVKPLSSIFSKVRSSLNH